MKILLATVIASGAIGLSACATGEVVHGRYVAGDHHERTVIRIGPPAPREEVIIDPPGPRDHWVWDPGHYRWIDSRYDWVPGHWIERPRPRAEWVAGRWENRRGEWIFIEGHWR